jgi:hypothetical protein
MCGGPLSGYRRELSANRENAYQEAKETHHRLALMCVTQQEWGQFQQAS